MLERKWKIQLFFSIKYLVMRLGEKSLSGNNIRFIFANNFSVSSKEVSGFNWLDQRFYANLYAYVYFKESLTVSFMLL